jgi:hypothetical protein
MRNSLIMRHHLPSRLVFLFFSVESPFLSEAKEAAFTRESKSRGNGA